jgi:hypothetical protein
MWRLMLIFTFLVTLASGSAPAEGLTQKEQTAAKKIYVSKCTRCHRSYDPTEYGQEEWQLWMAKMIKKSKLKPGQEKLLSRYLEDCRVQSASSRTVPPERSYPPPASKTTPDAAAVKKATHPPLNAQMPATK